jgi:O-antigen ligase
VIYISLYIDKIDLVLKAIIAGALCKALMCFVNNGFLVFLNSRAADNISANTIGFYCAFSCVIAWYFFKIEKRILYQVCGFLSLIFTILSGSRKALLFMIIPIAVMIILKSKNPLKILKNISIVCFGIFIIFFLIMNVEFLYSMVGNRIESAIAGILGYGATDASTSTRLLLIYDGIEWFKQRPIWGYGLSNYLPLRSFYRPTHLEYYAHNNYVELLVDCGIVGTAIYYVLHVSILLKAIKRRSNISDLSLMLLGMLISILVCDYAMVTYYSIFTHLILMLVYLIFFKETKQEYKLIS